MRFIKEKLNENKLFETGLARLWQHTKDTSTFAIIGTQDQDTKESRYNDMMDLILKLSRKKAGIGFNDIEGTYTYDNGKRGREDSIIIYNLSKEDALNIGRKLNQESIVWKDDSFFGLIYCKDGSVDMTFKNNLKNMKFSEEDIKNFASKIAGKGHAKNAPFVFESYFREYNRQIHKAENHLIFRCKCN